MGQGITYKRLLAAVFLLVSTGMLPAQFNISSSIYQNYAPDGYSPQSVTTEKTKYYDLFGEHITDGYKIYEMSNQRTQHYRTGVDSIPQAYSDEYVSSRFYTSFNNLVLSHDHVGGAKMVFIAGEQINTKFTPLTFNKRNFEGLRWDMWSAGLKMTAMLSRTRPGLMARAGFGGNSYVSYPLFDSDLGSDADWFGGDDPSLSSRTFFGDYDMLFGLHAENKIANLVNVGVTYVNHHHSDIEQGEDVFSGNLPKGIIPDEVHLEFTDFTSDITDDAGCLVNMVTMRINGTPVGGPDSVYLVRDTTQEYYKTYRYPDGTRERRLVLVFPQKLMKTHNALPCTVNGTQAAVVTFEPRTAAAAAGMDTSDIKTIDFRISVAGNYQVFISCEKLTPMVNHFDSKGNITQIDVDSVARNISNVTSSKGYLSSENSETYFGTFVAQTFIPVHDYSNLRTIEYNFTLPVSNVLYGINFDGEYKNFRFNGEIATTVEENQYPSSNGARETVTKRAVYLRTEYKLFNKHTINTDIYNLDAQYQPGLRSYQVSRVFDQQPAATDPELQITDWFDYSQVKRKFDAYSYLTHPMSFDNNFGLIDDNEDDDYYTENDRRRYPAENNFTGGLLPGYFHDDGTIQQYGIWDGGTSGKLNSLVEKQIRLPSGQKRLYEDIDGVIRPIYDKNKNSIYDYEEDFMLYYVDLPVFNMEEDYNNNGVYDLEEDDLHPDYPYQMGYVYTSNGCVSQGIRGIKAGTELNPTSHLKVNVGGVYQQILDSDIDGLEDDDLPNNQGKHQEIFMRSTYNFFKRSAGLKYFAGAEVKRIWDGLRNDAVITTYRRGRLLQEVDYTVNTDELRQYNSFVTNLAGAVTYTNIPRFQLTTKLALGLERHMETDDSLFITRSAVTVLPDGQHDGIFQSDYIKYKNNNINSLNFLAKTDYTFRFGREYRGRLRFLNVLQQVEIIPQYRFMYLYSSAGNTADPREVYTDQMFADDPLGAIFDWTEYAELNQNQVISVPIVRLNFKVGEKSLIQSGVQFMRNYDLDVKENSFYKRTLVAQLVNRDIVQGYDISIIIGMYSSVLDYDLNRPSKEFGYGSAVDDRRTSVFCKVYAGVKQ